jgi:hypothetical protein
VNGTSYRASYSVNGQTFSQIREYAFKVSATECKRNVAADASRKHGVTIYPNAVTVTKL